jgi:queuine tRNA-ribosyltransferase
MSHKFEVIASDSKTKARLGRLITPSGEVITPVFLPVGSQATVKTLTPDELETIGATMILSNAYHLYLRPGVASIEKMGGLHQFMSWHHPILTDSGGYQIFSLARLLMAVNISSPQSK